MSITKFIYKVFNDNVSGNRELILTNTTKIIATHCNYVLAGIVFGLGVFACYPFYDFCFNGRLTLVSPMIMPFVDETTLTGYLILTFVNVFPATLAVFGTYTFSCVFLTFVDFYDGLVSLVEDDFRYFDQMWKQKDPCNLMKRKLTFRNLMMELMDLAR